jgi:hypothetical protein
MEEQKLNSWEEFEERLYSINEKTRELQQEGKLSRMEYPIFRGLKNAEYHLKSTLDRIQEGMRFSRYLDIIKVVRDHIATCTGRKWDLETKEPKIFLGGFDLPLSVYEFMVYLRHNGFPSPLIDWTKSPYIAAFFAFGDVYSKAEHASIFVHRGDVMCGGSPSIWRLGSSIKTFQTHFLQQSEYSICFNGRGEQAYFANHEEVEEDDKGILVKYDIPLSERQKVLKKLDSMNITAYSLFGSEPSLMETLALREVVFNMEN